MENRSAFAAAVVVVLSSAGSMISAAAAAPQDATPSTADVPATQLAPVIVEEKPWLKNRETRYAHSLPEVDGATITVTKKTTVEKLADQPTVIDNNQRELFDRLPSIVIAEQQNPTQLNLTYRGIGNPQESEYVLSLQDGIPIPLDWIGYPTQYYLPIPQSIDSIQLIRGGSGLLYGPEVEPVINYISVAPNPDKAFSGTTEQVGGSDGLFSSFNRVSGTKDGLGYLADYAHRRSSGQRQNDTFDLNDGDLRLRYQLGSHQKFGLDVHTYALDGGTPGFLTLQQFQGNHYTATTPEDHLWTGRYTGALTYENNYSERGLVTAKLWTGTTDLATRADTYTGTTGTSASITEQRFYFTGLDVRVAQRWARANALTVGATAYTSRSPWTIYNDTNPNAGRDDHSGVLNYYNLSTTRYGAIFAENVFRFGRFHVVPSARFEHEEIGVDEKTLPPAGHAGPAVNGTAYKSTPLLGIGLGNDFGTGNETYLNISQGYRPVRYRDLASNRSNLNEGNNPDVTKYVTYEAGVHGWPVAGFYYDASLFQVDTKNRIEAQASGVGDSVNVNSGNTHSRGIEAETDYDFFRLFPRVSSKDHLAFFLNASLLNAKITQSQVAESAGGPTEANNTPAYAPHYVIKGGITLRRDGLYKLSLVEQSIGSQYWNDSNQPRVAGGVVTSPAKIPQYTVLDLSGDYTIFQHIRLLGGISNLTDRIYYSRVFFANAGIEPAVGRTFYAGAAYDF